MTPASEQVYVAVDPVKLQVSAALMTDGPDENVISCAMGAMRQFGEAGGVLGPVGDELLLQAAANAMAVESNHAATVLRPILIYGNGVSLAMTRDCAMSRCRSSLCRAGGTD